jgi:hypothetical protein
MKKRLFFYGINIFCNRFAVHKAVQNTASIFTNTADAPFIIRNDTVVSAQMTLHFIGIQFFKEKSFFQERVPSTVYPV